jgi:hypothetical protein
MNNANLSSVVSLLALSFTFALVGCAADEGTPEEKGETTSKLSCNVVPTQVVVGGKTVTTKKVVCDGSEGTSTTTTNNGSSCTLNGRKMICEGGGCIAVNGQPGDGCRWADDANAPAPSPDAPGAPTQDPEDTDGADAPDVNPGEADFPDFGTAGGTSSCTINGRKAVCDDGSCTAVNGQPGPGCHFVE